MKKKKKKKKKTATDATEIPSWDDAFNYVFFDDLILSLTQKICIK